jgi:predicted RNase H-like nuclease (RuvC/YqgF family)
VVVQVENKQQLDTAVYNERLDNLKTANEKLEMRISELEKKTDRIDNNFVKLETKFDIYTVTTSEKFDNLAKESREGNRKLEMKIDEFIKLISQEMKSNDNDAFNQWLKKIGLRMIEYAILAGIIYGVLNGLKLT